MLLSSDLRPRAINNDRSLSAICLDYIYEKSGKNSAEYFRLTSDDSWHCGQLQCSKTQGGGGGSFLTEDYGREPRNMAAS